MDQIKAGTGAAISAATGTLTWVAQLNEILQLVLTVVGILSGIAAIYYYIKEAKKK